MPRLSRKTVLPLLVLLLGLALAFVIANSRPDPQPEQVPETAPPSVTVTRVEPYSGTVSLRSQGVLRPRREIDLLAQVGGVVTDVAEGFVEGAFFDAQALLLQIDPRDYENALSRARARLADARQALATERGRARQARLEWRELGDPEANALFLREPQLASARAQVEAAAADVCQAEIELQRSAIRAPFAGRIVSLQADLGQFVPAGAAVATIYASDRAEVALPLSARQRELIDLGELEQGLAVTLRAGGSASWTATVRRVAARVDEQTRQLDLLAEIAAPFEGDSPLLIGQFLEAEIPSRPFDGLMRLPRSALRPGERIWIIDGEQRLRILPVRLLQSDDEAVTVQLSAGQGAALRVVTSYLARVEDGMAVMVGGQGADS